MATTMENSTSVTTDLAATTTTSTPQTETEQSEASGGAEPQQQAPSAPRAPSEAFPVIPKALQQRRADAHHRPYRPSPLSGKTSPNVSPPLQVNNKPSALNAPVAKSLDDDDGSDNDDDAAGEEEKQTPRNRRRSHGTVSKKDSDASDSPTSTSRAAALGKKQEPLSPLRQPSITPTSGSPPSANSSIVSSLTPASPSPATTPPSASAFTSTAKAVYPSSSSDEATKVQPHQKNKDAPKDEIAQLEYMLDAKMAELNAVEKKLLDTEQNAKRLLGILRTKFHEEVPAKQKALKDVQKKLFALMDEMHDIAAKSVQLRDQEIERQTTDLVNSYMNEAELLLLSIERTIEDIQAQEKSSKKLLFKTLIMSVAAVIVATIALVITVLVVVPPKTAAGTTEDDEDNEKWMWLVRPVHEFLMDVKQSVMDIRGSPPGSLTEEDSR